MQQVLPFPCAEWFSTIEQNNSWPQCDLHKHKFIKEGTNTLIHTVSFFQSSLKSLSTNLFNITSCFVSKPDWTFTALLWFQLLEITMIIRQFSIVLLFENYFEFTFFRNISSVRLHLSKIKYKIICSDWTATLITVVSFWRFFFTFWRFCFKLFSVSLFYLSSDELS